MYLYVDRMAEIKDEFQLVCHWNRPILPTGSPPQTSEISPAKKNLMGGFEWSTPENLMMIPIDNHMVSPFWDDYRFADFMQQFSWLQERGRR